MGVCLEAKRGSRRQGLDWREIALPDMSATRTAPGAAHEGQQKICSGDPSTRWFEYDDVGFHCVLITDSRRILERRWSFSCANVLW